MPNMNSGDKCQKNIITKSCKRCKIWIVERSAKNVLTNS